MEFAIIFNICLGIGMIGVIVHTIADEYTEKSIQKMMKTYFKRILRIKSRKSLDECPE